MISEIGSQQYFFIQNYGQDARFMEKSIDLLSQIPLECHELASTDLFDEQTGLVHSHEAEAMVGWLAELQRIGKKVISYYFNFPAVQVNWTEEAWKKLGDFIALLKKVNPHLRFIACNPTPLNWNDSSVLKSDEQLHYQLLTLQRVADIVKSNGLKLAYHFHEPELKENSRELNHVMNNIPETDIGLILDTNWCVMSGVDPMEIARKYASRIAYLHLRSSHNRVWDESLGEGDEKNGMVVNYLINNGFTGPVIIELAEPKHHYSSDPVERWSASYRQVQEWIK